MKPRHRFVVAHSRLFGLVVLDVDIAPAAETVHLNEDHLISDHSERHAEVLQRANDICAMMNREEEMRESVDAKVRQ
jgi:hypothetical protein